METNWPLIISLSASVILLFTSMVFSAMASSSAKGKDEKAHNYSMYSAIICGVAVALIGIALGIYIFRQPVLEGMGNMTSSVAKSLQGHADALQKHASAISSAVSA